MKVDSSLRDTSPTLVEQLTFTRFVAAFSIVVYHFGTSAFPFNTKGIVTLFRNGYVGVGYFFVLSGFVMVVAYSNGAELRSVSSRHYWQNRFARIYPLYLAALLAVFAAAPSEYPFNDVWPSVLLVQAWIPAKAMTLNSPGWSLSAEVFFYALFPLLANRVYRIWNLRTIAVCVAVVWVASQVLIFLGSRSSLHDTVPGNNLLLYFPLNHLNAFLIGNLAGLLFIARKIVKTRFQNWAVAAGPMMFVILLFVTRNYSLGPNYNTGLFSWIFGYTILALALNDGSLSRLFSRPTLVALGEASYAVYILQYPVFRFGRRALTQLDLPLNPSGQFTVLATALVMLAIASHYLFERPMRSLLRTSRT